MHHPRPEVFPRNVGVHSGYHPPVDYESLGQTLKKLRKAAGLSMKELGARLGYSYQWVDNIEGGRRRPDITDIERFAEACGRRVVFDIVAPDAVPVVLTPSARSVVDALQGLSEEERAQVIETAVLLQRARPGAGGAALSVLRSLQRAPEEPAYLLAVGDPND